MLSHTALRRRFATNTTTPGVRLIALIFILAHIPALVFGLLSVFGWAFVAVGIIPYIFYFEVWRDRSSWKGAYHTFFMTVLVNLLFAVVFTGFALNSRNFELITLAAYPLFFAGLAGVALRDLREKRAESRLEAEKAVHEFTLDAEYDLRKEMA